MDRSRDEGGEGKEGERGGGEVVDTSSVSESTLLSTEPINARDGDSVEKLSDVAGE